MRDLSSPSVLRNVFNANVKQPASFFRLRTMDEFARGFIIGWQSRENHDGMTPIPPPSPSMFRNNIPIKFRSQPPIGYGPVRAPFFEQPPTGPPHEQPRTSRSNKNWTQAKATFWKARCLQFLRYQAHFEYVSVENALLPAMENIIKDAQPVSKHNLLACLKRDEDRFSFIHHGNVLQVAARPSENRSRAMSFGQAASNTRGLSRSRDAEVIHD